MGEEEKIGLFSRLSQCEVGTLVRLFWSELSDEIRKKWT